ncbi:hypothetical protein DSECCO2_548370 [anaerobic digester metagenome]
MLLVYFLEEPVEGAFVLPFSGDLQHHEKVPKISPGELDGCGGHEDETLGLQLQRLHRLQKEIGFPPSAGTPRSSSVVSLIQEYKVVLHLSGLG